MTPVPTLSLQLVTFAADAPTSWRPMLELARTADRVGVDRLVVSDHVAFGDDLDAYGNPAVGGIANGRQPTGPDGHWLEPLTVLSVLAGTTTRVRLGTAILLAALRRPAVLAKQVATLDVLSGGRVDLGVGIGWQRAEYEACGLEFGRRGELLDHTLAVCRALWSETAASHADDHLRFDRIHAMPKPTRAGGVPLWISGTLNERTLRRIVAHGDGWIPWGDHVADPAPAIATLRDALTAAGRDPDALLVQGTLPDLGDGTPAAVDDAVALVPDLVAAGVTDFRIRRRWADDVATDVVADELATIVRAFRGATGRPTDLDAPEVAP